MKSSSEPATHQVEIIGNRPSDNSLIYRCIRCHKVGVGLLGLCSSPSGRTGRRINSFRVPAVTK